MTTAIAEQKDNPELKDLPYMTQSEYYLFRRKRLEPFAQMCGITYDYYVARYGKWFDEKYKCLIRKPTRICPVCGKEFEINQISRRYIACSVACRSEMARRAKRPSRSELKALIRDESFLAIGARYGVSDNAVRKWCMSYDLPREARKIKAMSDVEWEKV